MKGVVWPLTRCNHTRSLALKRQHCFVILIRSRQASMQREAGKSAIGLNVADF